MIGDAFDTRHIFRRDLQSLPLGLGTDDAPEMHDAIQNNDVEMRQVRPGLPFGGACSRSLCAASA